MIRRPDDGGHDGTQAKLFQKNEVISELMEANVLAKKRACGTLKGCWVPNDTRDQIVDYIGY